MIPCTLFCVERSGFPIPGAQHKAFCLQIPEGHGCNFFNDSLKLLPLPRIFHGFRKCTLCVNTGAVTNCICPVRSNRFQLLQHIFAAALECIFVKCPFQHGIAICVRIPIQQIHGLPEIFAKAAAPTLTGQQHCFCLVKNALAIVQMDHSFTHITKLSKFIPNGTKLLFRSDEIGIQRVRMEQDIPGNADQIHFVQQQFKIRLIPIQESVNERNPVIGNRFRIFTSQFKESRHACSAHQSIPVFCALISQLHQFNLVQDDVALLSCLQIMSIDFRAFQCSTILLMQHQRELADLTFFCENGFDCFQNRLLRK